MNSIQQIGGAAGPACAALLVAAIVVSAASPAWADNDDAGEATPRLYALPADGLEGELSDIVTQRINDAVRERYQTLEGVELVPRFEALYGAADSETAGAAVSEAEGQYTSGIGLVNAGQYEQAADTLQMAVEVLEENVADLRDFDILADALINLAIAYYETGYDLDARDTIEQYAHVEPGAELDPDDVPEGLRELYDDEVDRVERAGDGVLHIDADRDDAEVWIDGEQRGTTPLTVDDVGFGQHYMVVRRGDWQWSDKVRVRARGEEQEVDVELRDSEEEDDAGDELPSFYVDLRNSLQSGQFGVDLEPYLRELADQTGADYISWVIVVADGRDYTALPYLYRVDDQVLIEGDEVVFDRQLRSVRSRADALSDTIAAGLVHVADDRIVEQVDLLEEYGGEPEPEPEPVAEEPPDDEAEYEVDGDVDDDDPVVADSEEPSDELPVPEPEAEQGMADPGEVDDPQRDGNTLRYLGWGGAAAAATGVVAGTVLFFVRNGDSETPGFDVEAEW